MRQLERQVKALSDPQTLSHKAGPRSPSICQDDILPHFGVDNHSPQGHRFSAAGLKDGSTPSEETSKAKEVTGVNRHTKNVEFYGSSSSMALLSRVRENEYISALPQDLDEDEGSLVSQLYNPAFFPSPIDADSRLEVPLNQTNRYHQQCRTFLSFFFGSIHYIHPILDKSLFLARCEDLLSGNPSSQSRTFTALFYSLLSLGALVGPRDEELVDNMGNLEWSRKFFDKARTLCGELSMATDLEMVQCYFFMVRTQTTCKGF